tara:strand:- start:6349 stop:6534 length:186 start_codon:yes stop_codon:yes gene_type:complete
MNININKEDYETLLQVEEFLESEIYSTGNSEVDANISLNIRKLISKITARNEQFLYGDKLF